jgi:hypothetical protein
VNNTIDDTRTTLIVALRQCDRIDDPLLGVVNAEALEAGSPLWPGVGWGAIHHVATTQADGRRLEEFAFQRLDGGDDQPVSVMFAEDGSARLYGAHAMTPAREPMLAIDDTITAAAEPGDFLEGYFEHLRDGDLEASIAMFEPDGYIQHSNGHRYQGPEQLREDYTAMFKANVGRIDVRFCNVTDDGERRAFEAVFPNGRPAVAIYERGPGGKIAAIRITL